MRNVDIIGQNPMRFFECTPGLMAKALIVQLLRGALVIAVLFGVVTVSFRNHQKAPPAVPVVYAKPAPGKTDMFTSVKQVRTISLNPEPEVPLADKASPPASVVAPARESVQLPAPQIAVVPKHVVPGDDWHDAPIVKDRKRKPQVDAFKVRLSRYCSRRGKTNRSWIRERGVKHYCAL